MDGIDAPRRANRKESPPHGKYSPNVVQKEDRALANATLQWRIDLARCGEHGGPGPDGAHRPR